MIPLAFKLLAIRLFVVAAFALLAACSPDHPTAARLISDSETPRLSGQIDEAFTDAYLEAVKSNDRIAVTSTGGMNTWGLALAKNTAHLRVTLIIDDHCLSSCASFLLPSAGAVEFGADAIVGVHEQPILNRMVYERDFGAGDSCYMHTTGLHHEIYRRAARDLTFPYQVFERLQPGPALAVDVGDVCPRIEYDLTHAWWFPTSDQLRDLMGLDFTGSVCADDPACMRRRLPNLRMEGSVMVGDEIWTLPLE